ncbi:hypothetical protein [Bordetella bronchialis]|uniref:hypothetical protein n=1 Tax=Bordetella bronchialis TaxID=463025 RepID=UPI0012E9B2BB|nr:hypothetical protein [Bordetella bronchialis]
MEPLRIALTSIPAEGFWDTWIKPLLDLLTAVGTVGAVLAAVCLAKSARASREREQRLRAELAEAQILPELRSVHRTIGHVAVVARAIAEQSDGDKFRDSTRKVLLELRRGLSLEASTQLLRDFAPKEQSSRRLAGVVGQLPRILRFVDALTTMDDALPNGANVGAFMLLQECCSFGASLDKLLGNDETKYFRPEMHEPLAKKLGIVE